MTNEEKTAIEFLKEKGYVIFKKEDVEFLNFKLKLATGGPGKACYKLCTDEKTRELVVDCMEAEHNLLINAVSMFTDKEL